MNATQLIADIRDLVGDPTYDVNGNPQPAMDGTFLRAQTLVRWINQAQSIIGQELKGIQDWTALSSLLSKDVYSLDPRFFDLDGGLLYYDGLLTSGPSSGGEEVLTQSLQTGFALAWSISRTAPPLKIRLWPATDRNAGSTTLSGAIGVADTSFAVVNSASIGAGGPSYGWLLLGGVELVTYQVLNRTTHTFSIVARGQGGSKPVSHSPGASVLEMNIWIKGMRLPTPIALPLLSQTIPNPVLSDPGWLSGSYSLTLSDQLELPDYACHVIAEWCINRVRIKENDEGAAGSILSMFKESMKRAGKAHRRPRIGQAKVPGSGPGLWYGRVIVR